MKAIRCKSSSQVSSRVMIRLGLLLAFLLVVASLESPGISKPETKSTKKDDAAFQIFHGNIEKYELCVKLLRVCRKLRDKAPDYSDLDEEEPVGDNEVNAEDKDEYRKSDCLPYGLSAAGEKHFWQIAAKWQKEIDDRFLIQNLFVVIKTTDNGRNTNLAFGKWQGWCNRTDLPDETTESSEEDDRSVSGSTSTPILPTSTLPPSKNCDRNSQQGKWIFNTINDTRKLDKVIRGFSNFLITLGKYARIKCCPYESVRDRLEIIHDGIDFLQELKGTESSPKPEYTDINSDLSYLRNRLVHFNDETKKYGSANYSSGKCCPNILSELIKFENDFVSKLQSLGPQKKIIDYTPFIKKGTSLQDMYLSLLNVIRSLETSSESNSNTTICCAEEKSNINDVDQLLKDLKHISSLDELSKLIDPLKERLAYANESLSDAENQLIFEEGNLQKLTLLCGKECRQEKTKGALFQGLISKLGNLKNKVNNMSSLGSVNWTVLTQSVNNVNNMIEKNSSAKTDLSIYHEVQENIFKQQFQEIEDKQKDLEGLDPRPPNDIQLMLNQLETDLENLTENGINKLDREMQHTQLKFEMEKEKFDREVEEQLKYINLFREEMKNEQDLIDIRIAKIKSLQTPKDYDDKLIKLEATALGFSKQILSYEKELLSRIDIMQQQLKDLDKEIENTEHRANICDGECDLGDLDSVDKLIGRVQAVKDKLSSKSTLVKSKRKSQIMVVKTRRKG
ncbi:uncharacterized protein LOC108136003 [Drosophila elegans]|uniref:uncharacterized protein LOC108136003 n=1 Tax=Drosophila elegans TaxID=30023 RepID=UPI0007E62757|nr:uncharacterized protein LOC108136003 [Drosophila elegans]